MERHQDPRSFVLHLVGIPATILAVLLLPVYVMLVSVTLFLFALSLFLGGYALQFLGHALDGSEPGEVKAWRKWMTKRREARAAAIRVGNAYAEAERG
jgi:uncharacterized membrane protein YGL010W